VCVAECNSRCQLLDCLEHGVVEVVQPLPFQSPVEDGTNFSAGQPKFDVVHLVDHRVLGAFQSAIDQRKNVNQKGTHSDHCEDNADGAKSGLGGRDTESSFARFKASMAAFNAEMAPSRSLGRWDLNPWFLRPIIG
jgi:hypothetical protein